MSEERRVKSEEFKSRFPIKGHERKISEERRVKNAIRRTAHRKRYKLKLFTINSSLLTPLQFPTKSLPNPILEWEIEGRQWAVTTKRKAVETQRYTLRLRDFAFWKKIRV